jgi:hypothetical protein
VSCSFASASSDGRPASGDLISGVKPTWGARTSGAVSLAGSTRRPRNMSSEQRNFGFRVLLIDRSNGSEDDMKSRLLACGGLLAALTIGGASFAQTNDQSPANPPSTNPPPANQPPANPSPSTQPPTNQPPSAAAPGNKPGKSEAPASQPPPSTAPSPAPQSSSPQSSTPQPSRPPSPAPTRMHKHWRHHYHHYYRWYHHRGHHALGAAGSQPPGGAGSEPGETGK